MSRRSTHVVRVIFAVLLAYAVYGAIDPSHSAPVNPGADEAEHAVIAFALLLLGAAAFPRLPLAVITLPLLSAGVGLEALQAVGLIPGAFEAGDVAANLVGVGMALFALATTSVRNRALATRRRPDAS